MKIHTPMHANTSSRNQPSHRRKGKIARLPEPLRETVNTMLNAGLPHKDIIAKLHEHGASINPSNLTRWQNGGFQDYLKERLWLKEMQSNLDFILDHLRDNDGSKIPEAAVQLSSIRLFQFLRDFSEAASHGGPQANSTDFIRAANAACRLSQTTLALKSLKSGPHQSNQVSER
jgi:hypothetical protein